MIRFRIIEAKFGLHASNKKFGNSGQENGVRASEEESVVCPLSANVTILLGWKCPSRSMVVREKDVISWQLGMFLVFDCEHVRVLAVRLLAPCFASAREAAQYLGLN